MQGSAAPESIARLQEELNKRQSRAQHFGVEEENFTYVPLQAVDEEQRKKRAARFGIEYQAQDQSGLKDQSEDLCRHLLLHSFHC